MIASAVSVIWLTTFTECPNHKSHLIKDLGKAVAVPDTCNPSAPEQEARGLGIPDQPRLHSEAPFQRDPVIPMGFTDAQRSAKGSCGEASHTSTGTQ